MRAVRGSLRGSAWGAFGLAWALGSLLGPPATASPEDSAATRTEGAHGDAARAIVLQERVPLAFLLSTPTGDIANTSSSEIIRIITDLIEKHTSFFPLIADPESASECHGRIGCLARKVRPDYERALRSREGRVASFSELLHEIQKRNTPYPRYLLVLSNITRRGEADRLSIILIETDIALGEYHSADRDRKDWERTIEASINEDAILFGPSRREVRNKDETKMFLEETFRQHLSRIFGATGHWEPYGAIELEVDGPSAAIILDGAAIGASTSGKTLIRNVPSGPRRLVLEHPEREPFLAELDVERGQTTILRASLLPRGSTTSLLGEVLFWSGASSAIMGSALVVFAIARQKKDVRTFCFRRPGSDCHDGSSFQTLGYDPERADDASDVNPPGLLVAPLGYSLIGLGATWSVGSRVFLGSDEAPWITLAVGLAVGALSYSLSAGFND